MSKRIKALSLWQPWASLIAIGAKEFETRSWQHNYRGLVAIHAAKRWTPDEVQAFSQFNRDFPYLRGKWNYTDDQLHPLPLGAVLCVAKLMDIAPVEKIRHHLSRMELAFGNYSNGRYAWEVQVVEVFAKPIPCKGAQGLWDWTWEGGA